MEPNPPIILRVGATLIRILPFLFAIIFVVAAIRNSISILYLAVALHLIIIGAENTIGRLLADVPAYKIFYRSALFQDGSLLVWPVFHLLALIATIYLIAHTAPSPRQTFAIAAVFGYSVNLFSATVGHELLHRHSWGPCICSDFLYVAMLYPQFRTIHLASHHRWAGSKLDCQTPRPGQHIYAYIAQALIGGLRVVWRIRTTKIDPNLRWRALATCLVIATSCTVNAFSVSMFLLIQGLFTFILVETLNYIQHYRPTGAGEAVTETLPELVNQDLNFVSRCILLNLPLHPAHHADQNLHYSQLTPVAAAPSCNWGYWTSFWIAWTPPLWQHLHPLRVRGLAR